MPTKLLTIAAAMGLAALSGPSTSGAPFKSFVGHYRWNPTASFYTIKPGYREPLPEAFIERDGPDGIKLHERAILADGKQWDWYYDAAYDGKERTGSWITARLKRLERAGRGQRFHHAAVHRLGRHARGEIGERGERFVAACRNHFFHGLLANALERGECVEDRLIANVEDRA